jgi:hypothetical protein
MDFAMGDLGQLYNLFKSEFIERSVSCQIRHDRRQAHREPMRTAKQIGVTIPPNVLARAYQMIRILNLDFYTGLRQLGRANGQEETCKENSNH